MKHLISQKEFERQTVFDYYNVRSNPFAIITTKIDITNIYNLCKVKKHYNATIGYYLTKAMNTVEEFKYTCEDGKIYKSDTIHPSFTDMYEDHTIGYFMCEYTDNYEEFIKNYDLTKEKFLKKEDVPTDPIDDAVVWISCEPWFHFTSLIPPFDKSITVPQLIWDKFSFENDKCFINLMIFVHHGFADGYHLGKFISKVNELISSIKIN